VDSRRWPWASELGIPSIFLRPPLSGNEQRLGSRPRCVLDRLHALLGLDVHGDDLQL